MGGGNIGRSQEPTALASFGDAAWRVLTQEPNYEGMTPFWRDGMRFVEGMGGGGTRGVFITGAKELSLIAKMLGVLKEADPFSLLSRQGAAEMRSGVVSKMIDAMKSGTFDWAKSGPVEIAVRNGQRVIIDGHHRAAAAMRAGIKEIPVAVREVSDEVWETLMKEHLDTLWRL